MISWKSAFMLPCLIVAACSAQLDARIEHDAQVIAQDTRALCSYAGVLVVLDATAIGLAADASADLICAAAKAVPAPGPLPSVQVTS